MGAQKMDCRISIVTLGVADMALSRRFYEEGMGWRPGGPSNEEVVFFQAGGLVIGLYGRDAHAAEVMWQGGRDRQGFPGITLAQNVREKHQVAELLDKAQSAGATLLKPAQHTFWGGYSGYFADPDGHIWEIAWNPHFTLSQDGAVRLPG